MALLLPSPLCILADSPKPFHGLWSTLPSHLVSLVPHPPQPHEGPAAPNPKSTTLEPPPAITQQTYLRFLAWMLFSKRMRTATINFLTTIPNVRKWVSTLTFRPLSSVSAISS